MASSIKLLSTNSRVEAPFIEVNIGGYVFGKYSRKVERFASPIDGFTKRVTETFPNYVKSLQIQKVNGQVNMYTLTLLYVIQAGDDPNKIDKILSSVSKDRKMRLSYGDCNSPSFVYRDEEALITNVQQSINIKSSTITYTITGVSSAKLAAQNTFYFPQFDDKPSNIVRQILQDETYGLKDVFYGMRDMELVDNQELIPDNDKSVHSDAKRMSPFDYLNYLVSCMTASSDSDSIHGRHKYFISCFDDTTGRLGGPYFKIKQVMNNIQDVSSFDTYELDVGFPDVDSVISLSINTNDAYAILYDYSEKQNIGDNYIYRINDSGGLYQEYSPSIMWDPNMYKATQATKTWWAQMTQYPISAEVTIKGLLRPSILMTYVKLNTLFYGRKHSSSGTYIITKQIDTIDDSGYRSTLTLTRIKGEELK